MKVVDEIMDDLGEKNASDPLNVLASLEQRRRETQRLRVPQNRIHKGIGLNSSSGHVYRTKAKSVGDVSSEGLTLAELIAQRRKEEVKVYARLIFIII